MERTRATDTTVVVGGGLAGLTAAATIARTGRAVTVLEGGEHLGGRARTRRRDGFDLNLGPHALYRAGGGLAVLRRLGVEVRGRMPHLLKAGVYEGGAVVSAVGHLRANVRDRMRVTRAMTGLGARAAADWSGRPTVDWIDGVTDDPAGRAVLASIVRTATYTADHELLDAGAATAQLRAAAHGVLYLHGGWSSLVEGLADVVRANGGELLTRSTAASVDHDGDVVHGVTLADGRALPAAAVVIAVNDPSGRGAGCSTARPLAGSTPQPRQQCPCGWPTWTSPSVPSRSSGSPTSSASTIRCSSACRARWPTSLRPAAR